MTSTGKIDFEAVMAEVDLLSAVIDPKSTPFASKYLAGDKLVRKEL
jgi:hypothetical protein